MQLYESTAEGGDPEVLLAADDGASTGGDSMGGWDIKAHILSGFLFSESPSEAAAMQQVQTSLINAAIMALVTQGIQGGGYPDASVDYLELTLGTEKVEELSDTIMRAASPMDGSFRGYFADRTVGFSDTPRVIVADPPEVLNWWVRESYLHSGDLGGQCIKTCWSVVGLPSAASSIKDLLKFSYTKDPNFIMNLIFSLGTEAMAGTVCVMACTPPPWTRPYQ